MLLYCLQVHLNTEQKFLLGQFKDCNKAKLGRKANLVIGDAITGYVTLLPSIRLTDPLKWPCFTKKKKKSRKKKLRLLKFLVFFKIALIQKEGKQLFTALKAWFFP